MLKKLTFRSDEGFQLFLSLFFFPFSFPFFPEEKKGALNSACITLLPSPFAPPFSLLLFLFFLRKVAMMSDSYAASEGQSLPMGLPAAFFLSFVFFFFFFFFCSRQKKHATGSWRRTLLRLWVSFFSLFFSLSSFFPFYKWRERDQKAEFNQHLTSVTTFSPPPISFLSSFKEDCESRIRSQAQNDRPLFSHPSSSPLFFFFFFSLFWEKY